MTVKRVGNEIVLEFSWGGIWRLSVEKALELAQELLSLSNQTA